MGQNKNPEEDAVGQSSPSEPSRRTIRSWEELANNIKAGHEITFTCSHKGLVIKTFHFNDPTMAEPPPRENEEPVVEDAHQEPNAVPKARGVEKVASIARTVWAFMRALTLGNVILVVVYATVFVMFVLFWLLPMLAVVVPFLLGMTIIVSTYTVADSMLPDFPGKGLFLGLLFMLVFASGYTYLMRS